MISLQIQKAVKKAARREQLQREESEQKRLKTVLELQFLLDRLGEDSVRQELRQGAASVDTPSLLTDTELTALDELYKLVGPEPDQNTRLDSGRKYICVYFFLLFFYNMSWVSGASRLSVKYIP